MKKSRKTSREPLLEPLLAIGLSLFIAVAIFFTLDAALKLPEVHRSFSLNKCVRVIGSPNHSCANLPPRYTLVLVK